MDRFSEQAADEILAAFPEWRPFARSERRDDGSSYFVLEVMVLILLVGGTVEGQRDCLA